MLTGMYFLGHNILFTTNASPYWWRGISADISVFALTGGIGALVTLPRSSKSIGWTLIIIGIISVFLSSRAILNPISLWQFFLSLLSFIAGYQLFATGKINV
jgi:hypothetical protein